MKPSQAVGALFTCLKHSASPVSTPKGISILDELALHGLPARMGQATLGEIRQVKTPALCRRTPEDWLVLVRVGNGWAEILDEYGASRVTHQALWQATQGDYVELLPKIPWGLGFILTALNQAMRNKGLALAISLMTILGHILGILASWMIARMVDAPKLGGGSSVVAVGIAAMAALAILQSGLTWLRARLGNSLSQHVNFNLGGDLMRRILFMPYADIADRNAGDIGFAMESSSLYGNQLAAILTSYWVDLAQCLVGLGVVLLVSPIAGLFLVLFGVALLAIQISSAKMRAGLVERVNDAASAQMSYLAEALDGAVTVKAQGIEKLVVDRWYGLISTEVAYDQESSVLGIKTTTLSDVITRAFGLTVLVVCSALVMAGLLGIGGMMLVLQVGMTLAVSMSVLASSIPFAFIGMRHRVERIRDITQKPEVPPVCVGDKQVHGLIELRDVWFRYPDAKTWVLEGLTLSVEPKGKHWLKTPSGSGKTTILRLMAGLYEPSNGSVTIDGERPTHSSSGIMYLPQSVRLFSGSVMFNLRSLSGCEDYATLVSCAEKTGLNDFVSTLPMGYETLLHYGGGDISGGQRQLIAITAALASNKEVFLLDEAMADLDWELRPRIAALEEWREHTVVYASHDRFF